MKRIFTARTARVLTALVLSIPRIASAQDPLSIDPKGKVTVANDLAVTGRDRSVTPTAGDSLSIMAPAGDVTVGNGALSLTKSGPGGKTFRFYYAAPDSTLFFGTPGLRLGGFGLDGSVGLGGLSADNLTTAGLYLSPSGNLTVSNLTVRGGIYENGTVLSGVPAGAVMAFNLQGCPAGWAEFEPARGRFVRGIDKSFPVAAQRVLASTQEDAIRNITGTLNGVIGPNDEAYPWGFRPGTVGAFSVAYEEAGYNHTNGDSNPPGGAGTAARFDASQAPGVLVAEENRPKNVALLYCEKN